MKWVDRAAETGTLRKLRDTEYVSENHVTTPSSRILISLASVRFSGRFGIRLALHLLVLLACWLFASPCLASAVEWLPGDARQVTRSTSASRDMAASEAIVAPRFSVTLGSEFGLIAWRTADFTLRVGALALFGLESRTKSRRLLPAPGGDSDL